MLHRHVGAKARNNTHIKFVLVSGLDRDVAIRVNDRGGMMRGLHHPATVGQTGRKKLVGSKGLARMLC